MKAGAGPIVLRSLKGRLTEVGALLGSEPIDNPAWWKLYIIALDRRVRGNVALDDGALAKTHR